MAAHGGLVTNVCSACELLVVHGNACSTVKSFRQHVWSRVRSFLAILGWVLLEIGYSVMPCLWFGSLMNKTMRSESCKDYGCDGNNLLLIVATG